MAVLTMGLIFLFVMVAGALRSKEWQDYYSYHHPDNGGDGRTHMMDYDRTQSGSPV